MATTNQQESVQEPTRDNNSSIEPQEQNDDGYPEEKSRVLPKERRARMPREFDPGDEVTMAVHNGIKWESKDFVVASYRDNNGWEYQVKDLSGRLYRNGEWVREGQLSAA